MSKKSVQTRVRSRATVGEVRSRMQAGSRVFDMRVDRGEFGIHRTRFLCWATDDSWVVYVAKIDSRGKGSWVEFGEAATLKLAVQMLRDHAKGQR
jgi:hypothetical protein